MFFFEFQTVDSIVIGPFAENFMLHFCTGF